MFKALDASTKEQIEQDLKSIQKMQSKIIGSQKKRFEGTEAHKREGIVYYADQPEHEGDVETENEIVRITGLNGEELRYCRADFYELHVLCKTQDEYQGDLMEPFTISVDHLLESGLERIFAELGREFEAVAKRCIRLSLVGFLGNTATEESSRSPSQTDLLTTIIDYAVS